jgi:hypothetical protein
MPTERPVGLLYPAERRLSWSHSRSDIVAEWGCCLPRRWKQYLPTKRLENWVILNRAAQCSWYSLECGSDWDCLEVGCEGESRAGLDQMWRKVTILESALTRSLVICALWRIKLSLCLTHSALRHEDVWGNGRTDPRLLVLGVSWWWVMSLTPRPLYPRRKLPIG